MSGLSLSCGCLEGGGSRGAAMAKAMPPEVWCLVLVVVTKLACVDLIQVNVDVEILQHPHHRTKLSGLNLHISQSLKKKKVIFLYFMMTTLFMSLSTQSKGLIVWPHP